MGTRDVAEHLEVAIETNIESEAVIAKVRALRQEMFENLESSTHEVLLEVVLDRLDFALAGHPADALAEHDRAVKAEALEESDRDWANYIENWGSAVGDPEFTRRALITILRGPRPFGTANA